MFVKNGTTYVSLLQEISGELDSIGILEMTEEQFEELEETKQDGEYLMPYVSIRELEHAQIIWDMDCHEAVPLDRMVYLD